MRPQLSLVAAVLAAHATAAPTNPPIRNIYTFPKNTFIENIAVRSNSQLLITSMSVPDLFLIDPTVPNPSASVVHTFPNATGISGIAEVKPDVFAVITATWDLFATRAQPGTLVVWTVDVARRPPSVKLVARVQESTILNGIARHPSNPKLLLAADSAAGAVWRVDLTSGAYEVAFSSPRLQPTGTAPGTNLGINGLRAAGKHLYFTNSAQRFFGRIAVDREGHPTSTIEVLSNSTAAGADVVYDDIALSNAGGKSIGWIASHPSYAIQVFKDGSQRVVNDTAKLLNPTSAAFGRGSAAQEKTLYVTNGGEFVGNDLVNEGVVALSL
jgi:sugar lactone lactonase YvrE